MFILYLNGEKIMKNLFSDNAMYAGTLILGVLLFAASLEGYLG